LANHRVRAVVLALSAPIERMSDDVLRDCEGKKIGVAASLADLRAFLHHRGDGSTAGEDILRGRKQRLTRIAT
jgi:hypothetical protein